MFNSGLVKNGSCLCSPKVSGDSSFGAEHPISWTWFRCISDLLHVSGATIVVFVGFPLSCPWYCQITHKDSSSYQAMSNSEMWFQVFGYLTVRFVGSTVYFSSHPISVELMICRSFIQFCMIKWLGVIHSVPNNGLVWWIHLLISILCSTLHFKSIYASHSAPIELASRI
jgi:hypothetical protein